MWKGKQKTACKSCSLKIWHAAASRFVHGGADSLYGHHLKDVILGEGGQDNIHSYMGDDIVYSGDNPDGLYGYEGNDTLYGGTGIDSVNGAEDNDRLYGEEDDDWLFGNAGNDILDGGAGADNLQGGAGNDIIVGGAGNDTITAGADNDVIYAGSGLNHIYGEAGADIFAFDISALDGSNDIIFDFSSAQNDKVNVSNLISEYDPLTELISEFIRITDNGTDSFLSVDTNGGADNFVQIATLKNVTGLTDEDLLHTNGILIA